jgi:alpha-tubulin suppressor-like RCC1 family protein
VRSGNVTRSARVVAACAALLALALPGPGITALSAAANRSAQAIAASGQETCALLAGGGVDCWGANDHGQLGDGTSSGPESCNGYPCATRPVAVSATARATAIALGGDHACALLAGGRVDCWGANDHGQLGNGTSSGPQNCNGYPCATRPVAVSGLENATAIAAGGAHTCALVAGGHVECWGDDTYGQLGDPASGGPHGCSAGDPCATTPVVVSGISAATAVVAGNDHSCALLAGGRIACWGYNFSTELGDGTSSGPQRCAGGLSCSRTPVSVIGISGATAIVAGGDHTCALVAGGGLDCWGYNSYGQLGDGTSAGPDTCEFGVVRCAKTPVAVTGVATATAIAAGGDHTCGLLAGGRVDCWGANYFGELGDAVGSGPQTCNGYPCSETAVGVEGIANATAISAGGGHTCALLAGGRVACWGEGSFGQLGDGAIGERGRAVAVSGIG